MALKTQEAHVALFQAIVDVCAAQGMTPSPHVVITDFETDAMKFFGEQVQTRDCCFHLCQSIWAKIQESGLSTKYKEKKFHDVEAECRC